MHAIARWLTATALLSGAVYGQVPAANDTSDRNGNTGTGESALGGPAASNNGADNTASGYSALSSNTTGNYNTASGFSALGSNSTGNYNTAVGTGALYTNQSGAENTASGYFALFYNTTGSGNTASGQQALQNNLTGNYLSGSTSNLNVLHAWWRMGWNAATQQNFPVGTPVSPK